MSGESAPAWRTTGVTWSSGQAELKWSGPAGQERRSPLPVGAELALRVGAERRCTGLWRSGRRLPCPFAAEVAPDSRAAVCPPCDRAGRAHSVATDTAMDDQREYAVYLAHHGGAGLKVGITAVRRGAARLLEQGALASLLLVHCRLPAARRTESLVSGLLGVPERISTPAKRRARRRPADPSERAAGLLAAAERAAALTRSAAGTPTGAGPADHTAAYGLPAAGLRPAAAVLPLTPGQVLTGRVVCRIGSDLYLATAGGLVLLDSRLLRGWALDRAEPGAAATVGLAPVAQDEDRDDQDALF